MRMKLTDVVVKNLKPGKSRQSIIDQDMPGLELRVTPNGIKTWTVLYRIKDRKRRLSIGRYPAVSLAAARAETLMTLGAVKKEGRDPAGIKQQERRGRSAAMTFSKLADKWLAEHARPKLKPSALHEYERLIDKDLRPTIGKLAAKEITKREVVTLVRDKIANRGSVVHADHAVSMVSRIYSWAIEEDLLDINPAYKVKDAAQGASVRDRVLSDAEVAHVWHGLGRSDLPEGSQIIFKLAILLGQRRTELTSMAKSELNLVERQWALPGKRLINGRMVHGRTKNGRDHIVPLPDAAFALITRAIELSRNSAFVFPGTPDSGQDAPIRGETISRAMRRNRSDFGVSDIRTHDFRRTIRTFLGNEGIPDEVADRVLNHSRPGVGNKHYNMAAMLPQVRDALGRWEAHVMKVLTTVSAALNSDAVEIVESMLPQALSP